MIIILSAFIFLVLITLILIYAFRRILDKNVVSATSHFDTLSQDYDKRQHEINRLLEETKLKAQALLAQAQSESEKLKQKIITEAESERDKIVAGARTQAGEIINQADKARNALLAEIEERITKEAVKKASNLIQEALPESFRSQAHARWVDDLLKTGFGKLDKIRINETVKEVKIISAFPLTDEQRKKISHYLEESLGKGFTVKEEIDEKIVVGLVIQIGSLALDASLRNKIKEKAIAKA
ncbi:MAG: F0F1 ATP synthase subunit delta [Candidatus Omnitrophica bacterium]|nr:F0F1 ATP synthase subunit delta [Candidatus Omnitrophota bacterium]